MKKIFLSVLVCLMCGLTAFSQEFQIPERVKEPGVIQVLCIGNSFTYVHDSDMILREIARSQGLDIRIGKYLAGGYTFGRHLENADSRAVVDFGGYDFAFLQDQSANPARYSRDKDKQVLKNLITLKKNVLAHSPRCEVILERTWSYSGFEAGGFGTAESLDYHLGRGAAKMARKARTGLSPIGDAFNLAEEIWPDARLLGPDNHHQSLEGAYLKACVNYLTITGKPFSGSPASCGVDPEVAAFLRAIAQRTVLSKNK
ncbi:MAG: hypothetical protein IKW89_09715 [Bacteroidales bacterium]|nr:hypothetical protein [Bacteroidales bacterium]